MKQWKKVFLFISLLSSYKCFATAQFAFTCPDKFVGKVASVKEVQSNGFPKIEVIFNVEQTLKGTAFETKSIQVVKDGLVEFTVGKNYIVQTRESWLCDASTIQ